MAACPDLTGEYSFCWLESGESVDQHKAVVKQKIVNGEMAYEIKKISRDWSTNLKFITDKVVRTYDIEDGDTLTQVANCEGSKVILKTKIDNESGLSLANFKTEISVKNGQLIEKTTGTTSNDLNYHAVSICE